MKLIVGIDQKGDIRAHAARDNDPSKTLCGITPHLTQPQADSDSLCCRNCERLLALKEA